MVYTGNFGQNNCLCSATPCTVGFAKNPGTHEVKVPQFTLHILAQQQKQPQPTKVLS